MTYKWLFMCCFFVLMEQHALGQERKEVVTKNGDSIHSILKKNGIEPTPQHIADFIKLNKNRVSRNRHIYRGRTYILPEYPELQSQAEAASEMDSTATKPAFKTIPLFGPEHERVEMVSYELEGAVYYLVSGHGGPDPGAIGKSGRTSLPEDEYAYDVTLRLARRLIAKGATVYVIIRDPNDGIRSDRILKLDYDEVAYDGKKIPRDQNARLQQRVRIVNNIYPKHRGAYQRLVAIHVDSRSRGENIDVFFYHSRRSKGGLKLAQNLQDTFKRKYARFQPGRTYYGNVEGRGLYVLNYTSPVSVFIELGNIRSKTDQRRFLIRDNREALANWISEGLLLDYQESR